MLEWDVGAATAWQEGGSPELRTLSPIRPGSAFSGVRSQPTPSTPVLASRRPADQSRPELMSSEVTSPCPGPRLAETSACSLHFAAEPSPSITLPPATRKSRKRKAPPVSPVAIKRIHLTFVENSEYNIRSLEKKRKLRKRK